MPRLTRAAASALRRSAAVTHAALAAQLGASPCVDGDMPDMPLPTQLRVR